MLRRIYRGSRTEIEQTIKAGTTISENFLYAKVSKSDYKKAGFAIVVSKKIEKTSVGRHRIKRRISAAIESNLPNMNPNFKKIIVFFPKKTEKIISYAEIKKDTDNVLKKAKFFS